MEDVGGINTIYGVYGLIVVQLVGLIKIYLDRSNTKKDRDANIEALKTRQVELSAVVDECKSKSDTIPLLQKEIELLKDGHTSANSAIERLNSNMVSLQIEVGKLNVCMANLVENINKIGISVDRLFDRLNK